MKKYIIICCILVCCTLFFVLFTTITNAVSSKNSAQKHTTNNTKTEIVNDESDKSKLDWSYSTTTDEMEDSQTRFATVISENTHAFNVPHNSTTNMTIHIQQSTYTAATVYLSVSRGYFLCHSHDQTNLISVRFDNDKVVEYTTQKQINSPYLIVLDAPSFIENCKNAKSIKIKAAFYQEGEHLFRFNLSAPLIWE